MRTKLRVPVNILLAWLISIPALRAAELSCPYLNAATAEGILGGSVSVSAAGIEDNGKCEFLRNDGPRSSELRIEVSTMKNPAVEFALYRARCGRNGIPVHAIGNEAVTCSVPEAAPGFSGQAVGRVRDRAFVIQIHTSDATAELSAWQLKLRKVAEQVAGNLF